MNQTIAVVAPGAMGAGIGARLRENGARVLTSTLGRSRASEERAWQAGMEPVADRDLARAELVLSVVPPADAVALAARMAEAIRAAGTRPTYVDLNAISPQTVAEVQGLVEASGALFLDGGIVGSPPKPGSAGPTLYLSGPVEREVDLLAGLGLRAKRVAGGIGAASALKLCYSGLNKGLVGLGAATILAAERAGVGEAFRAELSESQGAVLAKLAGAMPDMLPKAYRWGPEMEEIATFIGSDATGAGIYAGLSALFEAITRDLAAERSLASGLVGFFEDGPH